MAPTSGDQTQSGEKINKGTNGKSNTIAEDQELTIIKDWMKKQPHLPDEWEDVCLRAFLRGCSHSLEKTKRKLDMYFTMRAACPEFFKNRDITRPEVLDLLTRGQQPTMPGLTADGRRISIIRGLTKDLETHNLIECYKIILMIADVRMCEESEEVAGDVYIFDADILTANHFKNLSPIVGIIKKFLICAQEAYPVKVKEVHVINISPVVHMIFNVLMPFIKDKIKKRIFFHKDSTGLLKFISKDMLPTEYGGTGLSLVEAQALWADKLKEYGPWLKKQENISANEALRPGKPTNYDELFGIDGSFRQLAID